MARLLAAAAVMLALTSAAAASAATVEVKLVVLGDAPVYVAAPGEKNDVLVSRIDERTQRIADPGASITAGRGCTLVDEHTAECRTARETMYYATVSTGDGDDTIRAAGETLTTAARIFANGGPGNDVLLGGPGEDGLNGGGGGHDVLNSGGGGGDTLTDGDSTGVDVDADEMDAGGGTISYVNRTAPVTLDLARSVFGEAGEGDVVRNATAATGGAGDDALNGDERANVLRGGDGDDRIVGRGGRDYIYGGSDDDRLYGQGGEDSIYADSDNYDRPISARPGRDVISGGPEADGLTGGGGPDVISGGGGPDDIRADGGADVISCGPEDDSTDRPQVFDYLKPGCETVTFTLEPRPGEEDIATRMRTGAYPTAVRRGSMDFVVGCPLRDAYDDGGCNDFAGRLTLRDSRGRPLGAGRVTLSATSEESSKSVTVRLNRRGRRLLARPRAARVVVSLAGGRLPAKRWTVRLSGAR